MYLVSENTVENAALVWLAGCNWQTAHGPDIGPDAPVAEHSDYDQVVLEHSKLPKLAQGELRAPAFAGLAGNFGSLRRCVSTLLPINTSAPTRLIHRGCSGRPCRRPASSGPGVRSHG